MSEETPGLQWGEEERGLLLDEAMAAAEAHRSDLRRPSRGQRSGSDVLAVLADLKEEKAAFAPVPEVLPLAAEALAARGIALDHRVKALLDRFDFFLVTFPLTLFPRRGWSFNRLECQVELGPGEPPQRRPLAHDVFPASSWQTLASANLRLQVGVTEELEFRTNRIEVPMVTADVGAQLDAGARFVLEPRDYCIKKARLLSRGRDDAEVFWRLDDAEFFREDEPRLAIVLKVPVGVTPVRAVGRMAAYRSFDVLSADLGVLFDYLGERVKTFFRNGAPLTDRGDWVLRS